jgi:hypothetical protein
MKGKSHKTKDCNCSFCKIVNKLPKNHLVNTFHNFMDDHGYDSKYIFDWNMPSWFRDDDLEDPSIFYFIILPFLTEKYNLDILNYLDRQNTRNEQMDYESIRQRYRFIVWRKL